MTASDWQEIARVALEVLGLVLAFAGGNHRGKKKGKAS